MSDTPSPASIYTLIFWLIKDEKIHSNDLFIFSELYWPTFIRKDTHIFLKEKYSEMEYQELIQQNTNPEYWINLVTVDDFFPLDDDKGPDVMAKKLKEIWTSKLKNDFPEIEFTIINVFDEETGDCGLTFYQKKYEPKSS